jgi:hypothetical protein
VPSGIAAVIATTRGSAAISHAIARAKAFVYEIDFGGGADRSVPGTSPGSGTGGAALEDAAGTAQTAATGARAETAWAASFVGGP